MKTKSLAIATEVAVIATVCFGAVGSHAQVTFREATDLVELDVSVFGADHAPLTDLTDSDFTLLEDSRPRPITAFAAVDVPNPPASRAGWVRDAPLDLASNAIGSDRLFVILIDDASLTFFQHVGLGIARSRSIAEAIIDRLGPSDLAAIVFTGDNRRAQDFTADHARLRASVEGIRAPQMDACSRLLRGVQTLREIATDLATTEGRRKVVIDITASPLSKDQLARPQGDPLGCVAQAYGVNDQLLASAQRANVDVFTVAPYKRAPGDERNGEALWALDVARETGGAALSIDASVSGAAEAAVDRILTASRSYYMLGYTSADPKKVHQIKVVVDRPGATVVARTLYRPISAPATVGSAPERGTSAALAGILPDRGLDMCLTLAPFAVRKSNKSMDVILAVAAVRPPPGLPSMDGGSLELLTSVFTGEGVPRGSAAATLGIDPSTSGHEVEGVSRLDVVEPGLYEVRAAARDPVGGRSGSVYMTVDAPDFAHAPLSLSGVVFTVVDGAPPTSLSDLVPIVPTALRAFDHGARARAFLRVYEGGTSTLRPVSLREEVVDDRDQITADRTVTLLPGQFGPGRAADAMIDLPTSSLPSGDYLLTLDAALDKTAARREARFSVR